MAFKSILFVCGFVLSVQNACSQVLGLGFNGLGYNNGCGFTNAFAPYGAIALSDIGVSAVDVSSVDVESIGSGPSYGLGIAGASGLGAANIGLVNGGSLGLGAANIGLVNAGSLGLGAAQIGLGNTGSLGLGAANIGLSNTGSLGLGAPNIGLVNAESLGLGAAQIGLGNAGTLGLGAAPIGLGNAGSVGIGATGLSVAGVSNAGLGGVTLTSAPVSGKTTFMNLGASSNGGLLPISSLGTVLPAGLTVVSDNIIEGTVTLNGQLPFLAAVAFEGALPSGGSGLAECGCGAAGNIGIISETVGPVAGAANLGGLALGKLGGLSLGDYAGNMFVLRN